ncbi:NAD-glutamate dehydrogenase domain-containing protein [Mycolicibacterium sp.]|uniref:NAD-glutamate dehydrogenase domain-containing protein n=1 Tax=Mycolicibacterium sp. TaxID=2320850 RepID=UPI00355FC7F7
MHTGERPVHFLLATDRDTATSGYARIIIEAQEPVPLRRILPVLESLDIEALEEHASAPTQRDGTSWYRYEFTVAAGRSAREALFNPDNTPAITDAFHAMWSGLAEADDFNSLILAAGLSWQQVAILRALGRYLGQTRLPYAQNRIQQILLAHLDATRALVGLFEARFGTTGVAPDNPERQARVHVAQEQVSHEIHQVVSLDADRILRGYASVARAMVRTNAFAKDVLTEARPWLAFKVLPGDIEELPHPRPKFEIFVYSPTIEGVHMRFGRVARGGLRWSDRLDDYRTEVLGLAKAQAVKNAVIVPVGAKGIFVLKQPPVDLEAGRAGYRQFISGLLDVTDNVTADGAPEQPDHLVCYDAADPYLVVAADKGTAKFSDIANEIAQDRGFWLGDAFASGGSTGYDHKALGITARGAWISATAHLRELGIDVTADDFTAVGIGDMSGDVFGNGMLRSPRLGLVAAFDHRHIFCDPTPDRAAAFAERQRLYGLPSSSWADYDRTLISPGGGVWSRECKTIPVNPRLRAALGIEDAVDALTPDALIRAVLCAPVDLLFNGGVGTYVKAAAEQHSEIGDKVNDAVRVDGAAVRARCITEGGNLGVSARGRIEFARSGSLINSDAIDNAAGVDCSDHEVNIKVLLNSLPDGTLTGPQRARLLVSMTDAVVALVLDNNLDHNAILGCARHDAHRLIRVHAEMVSDLEHRRGLRRDLENLPTAEEFDDLERHGLGLTAPQLATLLAHTKLDLKEDLQHSTLFDDDYFLPMLREYFPTPLHQTYGEELQHHPLRREIITTVVVNRLVSAGGLTFAHRLADDSAATAEDVVRSFCIAAELFDIAPLLSAIRGAGLPSALTHELSSEARRLLDRAARWLLNQRRQPLDIVGEISRLQPTVAALRPRIGGLLRGREADAVAAAATAYQLRGVPAEIARALSESLYWFSALDIADAVQRHPGHDPIDLADTYFALSDHLGIDQLLHSISALPRGDRWHAQARLALRENLYESLEALALDAAQSDPGDSASERIRAWEERNRSSLDRSQRALARLHNAAPYDLAALSVAATHIRRMTVAADGWGHRAYTLSLRSDD